MSNILNKVTAKTEELLHKHNTTNNNPHSAHTTTAPTATSTTTGVGNTQHTTENLHSTNHGPHGSNMANKVDPMVDSDRDGRATHGTHTTGTTHTGPTHTGTTHTGTHIGAGTGVGGAGFGTTQHATSTNDPRSTNHGPHSSNMANKLDPRVDSDRDGSRTAPGGGDPSYGAPGAHTGVAGTGSYGTGPTHTGTHTGTGVGGAGFGSTQHNAGIANENVHSSNHGPHGSNLANKLDPRVDSDRDGGRTAPGGGDPSYGAPAHTGTTGVAGTGGYGTGPTHTGTHTGTSDFGTGHSTSTNHGPHGSNMANKADPRFDSDLDGRAVNQHGGVHGGAPGTTTGSGFGMAGTTGVGSHTAGSGNAQQTAGPHNSNMLNKLDPRVDSDRDGSKTYGGNATYQ